MFRAADGSRTAARIRIARSAGPKRTRASHAQYPAPQQVVEDRKVAGLFNDLLDDCLDADRTAKRLSSGKAYKPLSSDARRRFDDEWDALLTATDATEKERDLCLAGKARDTRKLKACVQTQLDALSVLEQGIGQLEVLEDAALEAQIAVVRSQITAVMGVLPKLAIVQKDPAWLYRELQKAITAARDAKVKAAVTAASGAAGVCLAAFGGPVALIGGLTLFAAEQAVGAAFNGTEDSTVKKVWDKASGLGSAADALTSLPDAFGPAVVLAGGAVDIAECFAAGRDKQALLDRISELNRTFETTVADCAREMQKLGKICADAQKALKDAVAAVDAVRKPTQQTAAVLRYL